MDEPQHGLSRATTLGALVLALALVVVLGALDVIGEESTVRLVGMVLAALVAMARRRDPPPPAVVAALALLGGELSGGVLDGMMP